MKRNGKTRFNDVFVCFTLVICSMLLPKMATGEEPEGCTPNKVSMADIERCLVKFPDTVDQRLMVENILNTEDPERAMQVIRTSAPVLTAPEKTSILKLALKGGFGPVILQQELFMNQLGEFHFRLIAKSLCEHKQEAPGEIMTKAKFKSCEEAKQFSGNEETVKPIVVEDLPLPSASGYANVIPSEKVPREQKEFLLPGEKARLEEEKRLAEERAQGIGTPPPLKQSPYQPALTAKDDVGVINLIKRGEPIPTDLFDEVVELIKGSGQKGCILLLEKFPYRLSAKQREHTIDNYVGSGGNLENILKRVPLMDSEIEVIISSAASRKEQKELRKIKTIPFEPSQLKHQVEGEGLKE